MLDHGGRIVEASRRYGVPLPEWLDLSTGVNPNGWPVPEAPPAAWTRLPEDDDGLTDVARRYYGAGCALPVAGSQAAIQALPWLRNPCRAAVMRPAYAEHALAWKRAGHEVTAVEDARAARRCDAVIVINPNNPTGQTHSAESLLDLHERLSARGGWLIVDEAFMDAGPSQSLAAHAGREGLIVLRSLGKFFGLAGARVGFALAAPELLSRLQDRLGPWTVAGPSRWIAKQALADAAWRERTRARLAADSQRLAALLARRGLPPDGGCALFQWAKSVRARAVHEALARRGILTRLFADPPSLRFGLPGREADWSRLDAALKEAAP
jgi:L-threonine-O-3-phosphate decarboxylase